MLFMVSSIIDSAKNENVNTEIIEKICAAMNCDVSDIMEMTDDKKISDAFRLKIFRFLKRRITCCIKGITI